MDVRDVGRVLGFGPKGERDWGWLSLIRRLDDQSDQSELLPQVEARSEKEQGFTVK